jgi:hypothetical protein
MQADHNHKQKPLTTNNAVISPSFPLSPFPLLLLLPPGCRLFVTLFHNAFFPFTVALKGFLEFEGGFNPFEVRTPDLT